jgi:hypothetical protein
VSLLPNSNPNTPSFRDYSPGPNAGVDTDLDAHVPPDAIDPRARTALTLGVISLLFGFLTGIPAIWFGQKALRHINADGGLRGRWAAWIGIALGCVGVALTVGLWTYLHTHGN